MNQDESDLEAIHRAARLQEMGLVVRSAELQEKAQTITAFRTAGGNRAMRRAAKRASRRPGR